MQGSSLGAQDTPLLAAGRNARGKLDAARHPSACYGWEFHCQTRRHPHRARIKTGNPAGSHEFCRQMKAKRAIKSTHEAIGSRVIDGPMKSEKSLLQATAGFDDSL
jgi:hypothetical protein